MVEPLLLDVDPLDELEVLPLLLDVEPLDELLVVDEQTASGTPNEVPH